MTWTNALTKYELLQHDIILIFSASITWADVDAVFKYLARIRAHVSACVYSRVSAEGTLYSVLCPPKHATSLGVKV